MTEQEYHPCQSIEDFLAFLRETETVSHIAQQEEQEANDKTQDILHSLELEQHEYRQYAALAKELRDVRQKRRNAKDLYNVTLPILEWLDQNRPVVKSIERMLGEVRKAEKKTENRIYTPRTREAKK